MPKYPEKVGSDTVSRRCTAAFGTANLESLAGMVQNGVKAAWDLGSGDV
jgi:hypothetical protein